MVQNANAANHLATLAHLSIGKKKKYSINVYSERFADIILTK